MIPPLPPNFGFALIAVPTWRWEEDPVPPVEEAPSADGNAGAAGSQGGTASSQGRYVFTGYEWTSQVQWSLFPDAVWENAFGVQAEELKQAALRSERDRQQAQQVPPRAQGVEARHETDADAARLPENTDSSTER